MPYGVWISAQEDKIRLKSSPSANDETTYQILVLIEDKRRGSPVKLDSTVDSVSVFASSWHDDIEKIERVEDGRMSGECAEK